MLFLNAAITTANSLEERIEIRADLIYAGTGLVEESQARL